MPGLTFLTRRLCSILPYPCRRVWVPCYEQGAFHPASAGALCEVHGVEAGEAGMGRGSGWRAIGTLKGLKEDCKIHLHMDAAVARLARR